MDLLITQMGDGSHAANIFLKARSLVCKAYQSLLNKNNYYSWYIHFPNPKCQMWNKAYFKRSKANLD